MKSWVPVALSISLAGCAALEKAGDKATAVGLGGGLGFLAWLVHPVGWIGAALASTAGAIGALLFGGGDTVHEAPSNGWDAAIGVGVIVVVVLLLRSWAHWLPPLLAILKDTAKGTPRALLGGKPKVAPAPRFRRRAD